MLGRNSSLHMEDAEASIDEQRMTGRWDTLDTAAMRYVELRGVDAILSRAHNTISSTHGYHWTVLADLAMHQSPPDYSAVYHCLNKALNHEPIYTDGLILAGLMLIQLADGVQSAIEELEHELGATSSLSTATSSVRSSSVLGKGSRMRRNRQRSSNLPPPEHDPSSRTGRDVLQDAENTDGFVASLNTTAQENRALFRKAVASLEVIQRAAFLWAWGRLSGTEQAQALQDTLDHPQLQEDVARAQTMSQPPDLLLKIIAHRLLLVTALLLLSNCTWSETRNEYMTHILTPYRLWLRLHALNTKGVLHELFGRPAEARTCYQDVLKVLGVAEGSVLPPAESLRLLHVRCRLEIVEASTRIPVLCLKLGLLGECSAAFCDLFAEENGMYSYIPIKRRAALLQLYGRVLCYLFSDETSPRLNGNRACIEAACIVFEKARGIVTSLKENPHPAQTDDTWEHERWLGIPIPSSVLVDVPTPCALAMDLAYAYGRRTCRRELLEALQWGTSLEVRPPVHLLWSLALAYADQQQVAEAVDILQQCDTSLHRQAVEEASPRPGQPPSPPLMHTPPAAVHSKPVDTSPFHATQQVHVPLVPSWAPLYLAARLSIERLSDAQAGLEYATRGLNATKLGQQILQAVITVGQEDLQQRSSARRSSLDSKSEAVPEPRLELAPEVRALWDADLGSQQLLHAWSVAHAMLSRQNGIYDEVRREHRQLAHTGLQFLMDTLHRVGHHGSATRSISAHHAVVLAEMGEITEAFYVVRTALHAFNGDALLLHILALLLSCMGDQHLVAALAACRQAAHDPRQFPNVRLTEAILLWKARRYEESECAFQELVRLSSNWELFADADPRSLEDWDAWADDASHDGTVPANTPPKFLTTMDEAQQNCLLADIFTWNARLKRLSDDVTQAKASLQEAWQAMYRTSDLSGSGYDDDIQFWANAIEKYVVPPESAKAFRHLPVAKGFRLMTGSGWAASLATARESTILSESAALAEAEHLPFAADQLYRTALSTDPSDIAALLGLTRGCLLKASESSPGATGTDSGFLDKETENTPTRKNRTYLARAYEYTTTATRIDSSHWEAWYYLGRVYEEMDLKEQATDAFLTAMELQRFMPVRPFASVFLAAGMIL